jgi:hypothetical protein
MEGSNMTTQNTPGPFTRAQAITDIIASVAREQTALGRILDAEANKLVAVMSYQCANLQQIMEANQNLYRVVNAVSRMEMVLQSKLELFQDCLCPIPSPLMCAREE